MSAKLPNDFIEYTRQLFGEERWQRFREVFSQSAPVSIRLNPFKKSPLTSLLERGVAIPSDLWPLPTAGDSFPPSEKGISGEPVTWCNGAYYLSERPNFTLDPLFHAGAYYVQEASSMFLYYVVRQLTAGDRHISTCLDLCAAPGGKSTLLRAALPFDAWLYSNEPNHHRANILMENMQKQGCPNVVVTNNYPRDYIMAGMRFDMILADVPCSGEGMFRKDENTMGEWSVENVMKCQTLQRSIIEDIWPCLNYGGILVYSTCTFNTREDEENVQWIIENLGADVVPIDIKPEWNITGSLLHGFTYPVYRFIPGITKGEGLFMAVLKKKEQDSPSIFSGKTGKNLLKIMSNNHEPSRSNKRPQMAPSHAEALLVNTPRDKFPRVGLSKDDALRYLRHEALVLPPDTPKGFVIVTYMDLPLGFVKNIGSRANNLYPKEWKIRNL